MVRIHKEGRYILLVAIGLLLIGNLLLLRFMPQERVTLIVLFASILCTMSFLAFFRNPKRNFTHDENALISPADGKVVVVEEVEETEYFHERRIQVSIFMSVRDVHVNRWPSSGVVSYYKHHRGRFHAAFLPKASTENERATVVLKCKKTNQEIMIRQIAGALARRIVSYVEVGEQVSQNNDMGFIKFGSRVDLMLPLDTNLDVKVGDKVVGGISTIAHLKK